MEEEEEDEESKGVTSKIKSQFANFSVLSLLARKTPDKEEKVRQDCPHSDLDGILQCSNWQISGWEWVE